jgi:hypothetical protein
MDAPDLRMKAPRSPYATTLVAAHYRRRSSVDPDRAARLSRAGDMLSDDPGRSHGDGPARSDDVAARRMLTRCSPSP